MSAAYLNAPKVVTLTQEPPKRIVKTEVKQSARQPVAWLNVYKPHAFVITDQVKRLWVKVDASAVKDYTIPVYK